MSFNISRPLPEVRIRNWPSGRLSQLKLAVQTLESEVNESLASRSLQSERRKVSGQVPFILDLAVAPGFRQAQVSFSRPPGLGGHPRRQLLFYEVQHAADTAFANPVIIKTPQTNVTVAGLTLGALRSFRVRVVSTLQEVSVWSSVVTVRVAQSQIQQTKIPNVTRRLEAPVGIWQSIFKFNYTPLESQACVNAHIGVIAPHFDTTRVDPNSVERKDLYGGPAHVQLRWVIGSLNEFTQEFDMSKPTGERIALSARPGFSDNADKSSVRAPFAFGTFLTPFYKLEAGLSAQIELQAALTPGSEWLGPERDRALQTTAPVITATNGKIIEVLEDL